MSSHLTGDKLSITERDARAQALYQAGITAYKNGENTQAHMLFQQSAHLNPKNRAVWLALYQIATNDDDRITCLENALRLGIKNPRITERLHELQRRQRIIKGIPHSAITPAEPPKTKRLFNGVLFAIALIGLIVLMMLHFQIIP